MNDATEQFVAIALAATWCGFGLYGIMRKIERSPQVREMLRRFRRARLSTKAAVVAGLIAVVAVGGTKPGGDPPRGLPPPAAPAIVEPAVAPVEVRTNGVVLRAESASAVEVADWRKHGSSSGGVWLDFDEPFFAIGATPVSRAYVTASGSMSFESMRHPPVGVPLPDGSGLPALAPLLAPLGMVPEANWTNAGACSRFWHDAAPDSGRVFTWEDALLDRSSGRRVSFQAELRPSGDFTVRYDFKDLLDPPATNAVLGAQVGTNGVNALAVLGTNILSSPVWRVGGSSRADGVSVASLLCTNGVLRTPARFAVEWKNTSGFDPNADTDGDGLSDWDEVFRLGTDPSRTDTDGDGLSDGAEHLAGSDPLDADEDGDDIPDGTDSTTWASNPLWTTNGGLADCTIVLNSDLPAGTKASLSLGDLTIPLSRAGSWNIELPAGQLVPVRLFSTGENAIPLSIQPSGGASSAPPLRGGAGSGSPRFRDDPDGIFDGRARNAEATLAEPTMRIVYEDGSLPPSNRCYHDYDAEKAYRLDIRPAETGLTADDAVLTGFLRDGPGRLVLPVGNLGPGDSVSGSAEISSPRLDYGMLYDSVTVHHCLESDTWWCLYCLMYHSHDHGCEHDPGCPVLSGTGTCTCPPRVIRVSEPGSTNRYHLATCFVGTTGCCCPPANSVCGAILDSHDGNLVVSDSNGVLGPGDHFDGGIVVYATAPSGNVPSEIHYHLVGDDGTGALTNIEYRTVQLWAVRIQHEPVTRDRSGTGFYNPCGIVKNGTADFRFSLEPAAFPATNITWTVDFPNRADIFGERTGRSVVVEGKTIGPVKISVDIKGYKGPPPIFNASVVDYHEVPVKAYVVEEEDGEPVWPATNIVSLVPVANEIFTQVGIHFVLDPDIGHIADTNYLVIKKENGGYPLGETLVDLNHATNGVELYFVRTTEGVAGLNYPGGIILPVGIDGHVLAHELGHACGLGDILDFVEWKDPATQTNQSALYPNETGKSHMEDDWGTDFAEGYYTVTSHCDLITRLLMCGRRQRVQTNEDITFGDVDGLVFVSDASPPNEATCPIGFFHPQRGHTPSHQ